ncbi:MAG TPA: VIT1/CCC1 transporter family protein [Candidatus Binataceae bacterium]|nr:VIT1/CCC1 transporter family protein [Candidatus Binataceae bacterium]
MAPSDPAEKRRLFERLSSVREIVFGVQDGVLTTAGVLAGLSGAVSDHTQIVLAALASTAAGALSMGAGAYLGTRAESEVMASEVARTRRDAQRHPYVVQEALLGELEKQGLTREAGYRVVQLLSSAPDLLLVTAEEKVYGLAGAMHANAALDGVVMGIAFAAGALVPLVPYLLVPGTRGALGSALGATALALFGVGYFEGWMARRTQRWRSGVRFLSIAVGAAVVGYLIGLLISPLGATAG